MKVVGHGAKPRVRAFVLWRRRRSIAKVTNMTVARANECPVVSSPELDPFLERAREEAEGTELLESPDRDGPSP